jgi:hypothetical protein
MLFDGRVLIEVSTPKITLARVVMSDKNYFYNQDWYFTQDFAHTPIEPGTYTLTKGAALPAAVVALAYMEWTKRYEDDPLMNKLETKYMWTGDTDDRGDRVYVGNHQHGFQIHRHLTLCVEDFIDYESL